NLNYTWEMSTWLSFFINLHHYTGITGQTAIFAHFVRNRHFSSKLITDKASIFIDLSVNGRAFAKCSD
ncbi:hypothetical protein, partial [Ligilactobacillus ruminis]|uniref:hypothetical protein n=1 Tax=Ligilactobacillus ruminis TaxID=1623 RepID=UPI0034A29A8B